MTLQHVDVERRHGKYCAVKCALCSAAARMTLAGYRREADQVLEMRAGQIVETEAQNVIVRRFMGLSDGV